MTAVSILIRLQRSLASWTISSRSDESALWCAASSRSWAPYLGSLALVGLITLFGLQIEQRIAATNVAMLYLLAVVVSALRWGRAPAMVAAVASTIAFDLFMIPPFMRIGAADFRYAMTLISLLAIGLLIGTLAGEAREQAETARTAQASTAAMYAFSQSLASSNDLEHIVSAAGQQIVETFHWPAMVVLPGESGLSVHFRSPGFPDTPEDNRAAEFAFQNSAPAGRGTRHLPAARGYYLPLRTAWGVKGVLGVVTTRTTARGAARQHPLLEVFAGRAALAIGRSLLEEAARQTELLRETDKMQKALLHSISHNLRTPLATVTGALQSLLQDRAVLDEEARTELLTNAEEQAARLNRLVGNLLDMTRLEAGALQVKREPCDVLDRHRGRTGTTRRDGTEAADRCRCASATTAGTARFRSHQPSPGKPAGQRA